MKSLYFSAAFFIITVCRCVEVSEKSRVYVIKVDPADGPGVYDTTTRTALDCARMCSETPTCRRFSFNQKCWISPNTLVVATTGAPVYGRQCPFTDGFATHLVGSKVRCLKDGPTSASYFDARDYCLQRNAHLFTLESLDDFNYLGPTGNNMLNAWVDGGTENVTWYGGPLPYTPWGMGFPNPNECVYGFQLSLTMETMPCITTKQYVCQVDV